MSVLPVTAGLQCFARCLVRARRMAKGCSGGARRVSIGFLEHEELDNRYSFDCVLLRDETDVGPDEQHNSVVGLESS